MLSKPFADNLKAHRKRIGLIQTEVALRLRLDRVNRISRWEKGSSVPSVINLFKPAALYGVPPHELHPDVYRSVQMYPSDESVLSAASTDTRRKCP